MCDVTFCRSTSRTNESKNRRAGTGKQNRSAAAGYKSWRARKFGRRVAGHHQDIRTSGHQDIRASGHQDIRTSGYQDSRRAGQNNRTEVEQKFKR